MRQWSRISRLSICGLVLLLVLQIGGWASAAVTANSAIFVQTPKFPKVQLTNAMGSTPQTLYTCSANGTKIIGAFATSSDTSARDIQLSVLSGGVTYILNTTTVALNSGFVAGTLPVNLMNSTNFPGLSLDADGNQWFMCASGDVIQAASLTTITSAKLISVMLIAADF